ncbi:MAG: hypothetical protein AB7O38_28610 [Pirellulaceae bacterium]
MRILVTIPHFFARHPESSSGSRRYDSERAKLPKRKAAVEQCLRALHQLFGTQQSILNIADRKLQPAPTSGATVLHVVVCTTRDQQLLDELPFQAPWFQHHPTDIDPRTLGFHCRRVLRDRWGNYDFYGYLEDDLIIQDPWWFAKLAWFSQHVGDEKLLLPNRFELSPNLDSTVHKLYIDGDLAPRVTARFQDVADTPQLTGHVLGQPVVFRRPLNPHAGCYFLNARQMEYWIRQPYFLDGDTSFVGPLESAATLGVMRAFKIYKPAHEHTNFFEVLHHGTSFLSLVRGLS